MELADALDLVGKFGVPLALLMWRDIRSGAAATHRLELRLVKIETTLNIEADPSHPKVPS